MSAQDFESITVFVALNSLMAIVGGVLAALFIGKNAPGFIPNGSLAGLVAIFAGSDIINPLSALFNGIVAGALFVYFFPLAQNKLKWDKVPGVWPLNGICGTCGGIADVIFGSTSPGGLGGVSLVSQIVKP